MVQEKAEYASQPSDFRDEIIGDILQNADHQF